MSAAAEAWGAVCRSVELRSCMYFGGREASIGRGRVGVIWRAGVARCFQGYKDWEFGPVRAKS
jgi:hypothetical protein